MKKNFKNLTKFLILAIIINSTMIGSGYHQKVEKIRSIEIAMNNETDKYSDYFDYMEVDEIDEFNYKINLFKKSTDEVILDDDGKEIDELTVTAIYNHITDYMEVEIEMLYKDGEKSNTSASSDAHLDETGNINGTITINDKIYEINEIEMLSGNDEIVRCAFLSISTIIVIVASIVGAVVGGYLAWRHAKVKKVSVKGQIMYTIGGIVIGSVVGAAIGISTIYTWNTFYPKMLAAGSTVWSKPNMTQYGGYNSFDALKRFIGSAGTDRQWHHIVSQASSNVTKFGATKIHNVRNVVNLSKPFHEKVVTAYMNSKPGGIYGNLTVGQYIRQFDFNKQYELGMKIVIDLAERHGERIVFR